MDAVPVPRACELTLGEELAAGTFARLYRAELRVAGAPARAVAVKVLREQWVDTEEVVDRTRDEARLLASLRHPAVVRVDEALEIDGQLALVMELVDGVDLKQLVEALGARGARVPARVVFAIGEAVARALHAVHHTVLPGQPGPLRLVHRDVKPPNLMLDAAGAVKVLDFGTARTDLGDRIARTANLRFGSLKYMSPERREGERGELPSDVYGLGMVMLELLRGAWLPVLPLDPEEHDEAVVAHVAELDGLGMPDARWDRAARELLVAMLRADPARRPETGRLVELLASFVQWGQGPTLAAFGAETVAPLVAAAQREGRPGEWTGRVVRWTGLVEAAAAAAGVPAEAAPRPAPPAPRPAPPAPRPAPRADAPRPPEPRAAPPAPGRPAPAEPLLDAPVPPRIPRSVVPGDAPPAPPAPRPRALLGLGCVVVGLAGLAAVALALWPEPPPPPPRSAPLPAAAALLAGPGVPVRVTLPGATALRLDGPTPLAGGEPLAGAVPPGAYTLRADLPGGAVAGPVTVPAGGLVLTCRAEGRVVTCDGGVTLR